MAGLVIGGPSALLDCHRAVLVRNTRPSRRVFPRVLQLAHQLRQLGDVRRDAAGLRRS